MPSRLSADRLQIREELASVQCARVLHFTAGMNRAGAETLIMNVYRQIDRERLQFDFLLWEDGDGSCDFADEITALGGRLFMVPNAGKNLFGFSAAVLRILRSHRFVAVHSHLHYWNGIFLALANIGRVPLRLCHSHNTQESTHTGPLRKAFNQAMKLSIQANATHLMAPSVSAGESLFGRNCLKDARFSLIKNAINSLDYEHFPESSKKKQYLGFPPGSILIGHIGRMEEQKNHFFLLQVFHAIRLRGLDAHLILVGKGGLRDKIVERVTSLGLTRCVHFLGSRSDVPQILQSLDLLLFPSLYEGLGIVTIEAQAAGIPVVASDAVPQEADLQLGLLTRLSLQQNLDDWATASSAAMTASVPAWLERKAALVKHGYEIGNTARYLQQIYLSGVTA